jgi:hypothetical protein
VVKKGKIKLMTKLTLLHQSFAYQASLTNIDPKLMKNTNACSSSFLLSRLNREDVPGHGADVVVLDAVGVDDNAVGVARELARLERLLAENAVAGRATNQVSIL